MPGTVSFTPSEYANLALILVVICGFITASTFRLIAFDRITRAPRHAVLRRLGKWRRERGSVISHHLIYLLGCPDCFPMWIASGYFTALWALVQDETVIHLPLVQILALGLATRYVARWLMKQIGWSGVAVIGKDGKQKVDGVRDFPATVVHSASLAVALAEEARAARDTRRANEVEDAA